MDTAFSSEAVRRTVIDCTNAVDYADGLRKLPTGSAVEHIAERAVGSHVVKALHLFAGTSRLAPTPTGQPKRTVAMCGDDDAALGSAAELVRDLGGVPAVPGLRTRPRPGCRPAVQAPQLPGPHLPPARPGGALPAHRPAVLHRSPAPSSTGSRIL